MLKASDAPTIMVVDDTRANLQLLQDILQAKGYRVVAFPGGSMALKAAARRPPDLFLLDVNMPEMNGYEVCRRLKAEPELKDIPVLFVSALSETADKVRAFAAGGVDYVTKPFQAEEVHARVDTHLRLRSLQKTMEEHNRHLEALVQEKVREISQSQLATIHALSELMETRDYETGAHINRTRMYCRLLALQLRKDSRYVQLADDMFIENIYQAAPLHDIGKFGITEKILLKPGKLTREEFECMKSHTTIGALTLKKAYARHPNNDFLRMGIAIARSHHEKWDGNGYPDGLSGESIPLSARIMAVADVYDALRSKRPYKSALAHEQCVKIITDSSGTHFDPRLVVAFEAIETEFARMFVEITEEGQAEQA
ncbi:response regulator [Desulfonatronovibrio magnus]|uniref:response regulator n=1 Tax=Desulfonatronovibrio magnus TaxID=698827 RepID=UPI0005EB544E|nr:HD domain-containing phosphohydrolase [Desulfonatronovibrio magnus]